MKYDYFVTDIGKQKRQLLSLSVSDFNLQRLAENRRRVFTLRFQRGSDSALTQQAFQSRPRNTSHGPDPVAFTRNAARRQPRLLRRWGRRSGGYSGLRSVRQIERSLKSVAENLARSSP